MKKMKKTINSLIAAACLLPAVGMAATTVTLNPVADAYVQGGNKAAVNYGSATELRAQTNNSPSNNYDSYLRFDTSAIAEQVHNSVVVGQPVSVKLRVYAVLSGSGSVSTRVYGVSDTSWSESAITWNTKPVLGSNLGSATVASTTYAWQEIDVSTYVENEISAGRNVISLALHNGATQSVYVNANSREAVNPPQLVITFNNPPTVTITAPAEGGVYSAPANVAMSADAIDSDGSIAYVAFVVYESAGAHSYNTVEAPPFTYTLSGLPVGSYTIYAKATDNDGGEALYPPPTPVSFTVNPAANVPPSVSLTAPTSGSTYTAPASVTLTADATDGDGSIASVEFYDGATLIASLTAPPYSYTWNDVAAGSHSLTAKATDNLGAATTSTPATISVNAAMATGVYYIHADHLNTPRVITDANNRTVWRWDSDPFGAEKPNEDPDGDGAKFTYNLRFPGQYYDKETHLHYNYFRDYDPTTGRYVQSDPIGLEGGGNLYTYVLGNPISYTDPLGLSPYNDPMNQIANRVAGLPPNANLPPPIKGTVTANFQLGRIGPIPVGVTYQCTINEDGMKPNYLGAGIVINRSLRYGATATSKNGDPSGYGVRTSISAPVVKGGGFSASSLVTSTGSATSVGVQTIGVGASGAITYGYSF